jgi:Glycosyltransferase
MIYSRDAVSDSVHCGMKKALGKNAIALDKEKHLIIGNPESNFANTYIDIPYQKGLLSVINHINPDLIISDGFFQWTFYGALRSWRRKLVVFYERTAYVERNVSKWRVQFRKLMGKFIDGFCINGFLTRQYLQQIGMGDRPMAEGCMVADAEGLQMAVDECDEEIKSNLRKKISIADDGLLFLFVGQLVERKGVKELIEAWIDHINVYSFDKLIVVGEGILENKLKKISHGNNSIIFTGQIDYEHIPAYYAIADVFVMPTLEDNWSLVVPEAMACGKPIATTPYNGCHVELLKDGINGYLFDPYKKESTKDMLKKFHSASLDKMSIESAKIVENYTPKKAAAKIYKLCQKLILPPVDLY